MGRAAGACHGMLRADVFGYEPAYTFHGYRSVFGALSSVALMFCIFLRLVTTASNFANMDPIISENRELFEPDGQTPYTLPKLGVIFKRTGWQPFYDPTYFRFRFQQGCVHALASRARSAKQVRTHGSAQVRGPGV